MATHRVYTQTRSGWWNPTQWIDTDPTRLVERLRACTTAAEIRRETIGGMAQAETVFSKPRGRNAEVTDHRPVRNGQTKITTRVDPKDRFERTAVELKPENWHEDSGSIDVLVHGQLLCRVNLSANNDGTWGNVDVILNPDNQQGRFLAFRGGEQVVSTTPEGVTAYSVDISRKEPPAQAEAPTTNAAGNTATGTETDESD